MWRGQRSSPSGYLQAEKVLEAENRGTSAETRMRRPRCLPRGTLPGPVVSRRDLQLTRHMDRATGAATRGALVWRGHAHGGTEPRRLLRRAPKLRRIGYWQGSWSRLSDVRRMRRCDHRAAPPPAAPATRGELMTRCWFSVFAVFCGVLALAPPASAECAWVLWRKINPIDAPEAEWSIE